MPDLDDMLNEPSPVEFEYRGRKFTLQAYPERSTRELRDECAEVEKKDEGAGDAHFIKSLVESWDVTKGGQPLPVERETIQRKLSPGLRLAMASALLREAAFPTPPQALKEAESVATSPSTSSEAKAESPAGT